MGRAFSFGTEPEGIKMDDFKVFKNFKERGEWVELRFMAEALRHGGSQECELFGSDFKEGSKPFKNQSS